MTGAARLRQLCPRLGEDEACELAMAFGEFPSIIDVAGQYFGGPSFVGGEVGEYLAGLRSVMVGERESAAEIAMVSLWSGVSTDFSVEGDLTSLVGLHHHRLGDLPGALALFGRALEIDCKLLGAEHPNVARDWNHLGLARRDRFDLPPARKAFETALAIAEALHGPEHPLVARYVNNLGTVVLDMGDAVGALAAFQRAFRIDTAAFGDDHVSVAVRASNLGNVLRLFDDFPEARGAYLCAHDIFLRKLGPDHPNTRTVAANLAALGDHG